MKLVPVVALFPISWATSSNIDLAYFAVILLTFLECEKLVFQSRAAQNRAGGPNLALNNSIFGPPKCSRKWYEFYLVSFDAI